MTFFEARVKSQTGLHVRRAGWTDKWFIDWLGVWWCMGAAFSRPVETTDYTAADLTADDWTTVPLPLVSCPVPPGTGGGGSGGSGSGSGTGGGGSSPPIPPIVPPWTLLPLPGPGSTALPPPNGTGLTVKFEGLVFVDDSDYSGVSLNGRHVLPSTGRNSWELTGLKRGTFRGTDALIWAIGVNRLDLVPDKGKFDVLMTANYSIGGFANVTSEFRLTPMNNSYTYSGSTGRVYGGTAEVL